jgi:hypothetical protein
MYLWRFPTGNPAPERTLAGQGQAWNTPDVDSGVTEWKV